MSGEEEIHRMLAMLTPEQKQLAENITQMRIENNMLRRQATVLKEMYDHLYKLMLVILDNSEDKELRVHESQFLRFSEEYRIDRSFDLKTREVVFKLLTLREPLDDDAGDEPG